MRGLYIGDDVAELVANSALVEAYSKTVHFEGGWVIYNKFEWASAPIHVIDGRTLVVAGWFVYKGRKNDIEALAKDLLSQGTETLKSITSGSFIAYWRGDEEIIFVDPLGMSNHYIDKSAKGLRIAPSVKSLLIEGVHKKDPLMQGVLDKMGHLFGVYTVYSGIVRLEPGCIFSTNQVSKYTDLTDSDSNDSLNVLEFFSNLASHWQEKERILPISGGLDSRLILSSSSFLYGFTYGPESSIEVKIAKKFSDNFENHHIFDFQELVETEEDVFAADEMAFGVLSPNRQLLTNYKHVKDVFPSSNAFFDGYLGEVFQRGTYITFKGLAGELFKIFPLLYKLPISEFWILKKRYKKLNDEEFFILREDYLLRTSALNLNPYQRLTYYEALYGRGARYILFGSNVLAAQIFTNVSPFTDVRVFSNLVNSNINEAVSFKRLKYFWRGVDCKYRVVPVESGYTPDTPHFFINFVQFVHRVLFHVIPSRGNYGVAMKRRSKGR